MKLAHLKTFLVVADTGSFSEAGLKLGISQAAVSYAVAELENHLKVKLLERGHFGAQLTPVGERMLIHARSMVLLQDAMEQEASLSRCEMGGQLCVVAFRSAAGKIAAPLMAKLRTSHAALQVHLTELDNEEGSHKKRLVKERKADIAFVDDTDDSELIFWRIMCDRYVVLLRKSDPRELIKWTDITSENLILSTGHSCGNRVERHFTSLGQKVKPAHKVHDVSTIAKMVAAGLGVGLVPTFAIDRLPDTVKCVPTQTVLQRPIYICLLLKSLKVPAVRVFLHALKDAYPDSEIPLLGEMMNVEKDFHRSPRPTGGLEPIPD